MTEIATLDPARVYAFAVSRGGAIVGQPVVPEEPPKRLKSDRETSTHPTSDDNPVLWVRIVGSARDEGLYDVEVPLRDIVGAFWLGDIVEPCIQSPADPLWRQLPLELTWPDSFVHTLTMNSLSIAASLGYESRCVESPRRSDSFPHPVSFPRFAPFVPERPLVVYFDPVLASRHLGLEKQSHLLNMIRQIKTEPIPVDALADEGTVICVEGAIAFFDPPQIVTFEGRPGELVVITPTPTQSGAVTEEWLLGFVKNECFPFFRESVNV